MKLRITRRAINHINQIERDTLAVFGEKVTAELLTRIERATQNLAAFPLSGRSGRVDDTREVLVPNTPFLIAYRIKRDEVHLLAVLHGARRWPSSL